MGINTNVFKYYINETKTHSVLTWSKILNNNRNRKSKTKLYETIQNTKNKAYYLR